MRTNILAIGAVGGVVLGIAYIPACSSPKIVDEGGPPAVCMDAGGGQGQGCACDPNAKTWAQPKPCFEGPTSALKAGTACRSGKRTCSPDGVQSECAGQVLPSPEVCNGIDDDCNGIVDDIATTDPIITDFTDAGLDPPIEAGAQCYVNGETGLCAAGRFGCNAMAKKDCVAIVPKVDGGSPYTEVCNGIDDDCNAIVDDVPEQGMKCMVMYDDGGAPKGECAKGTTNCTNGFESCVGAKAIPEICNGKDDNCNGQYDEGVCPCGCGKGQWCCVSGNQPIGGCWSQNPNVQQWSCYQVP